MINGKYFFEKPDYSEVKELLDYAKEKNIKLIMEVQEFTKLENTKKNKSDNYY